MAWKPYQDQQNRSYSSILTTLFPEQTKTLPRILVWSSIFLLDLTILAALAISANAFSCRGGALLFYGLLVGVFWLQGRLWGMVCKFFKKSRPTGDLKILSSIAFL